MNVSRGPPVNEEKTKLLVLRVPSFVVFFDIVELIEAVAHWELLQRHTL